VFDTRSWTTRAVCLGHTDWIFGTQFVSDDVVFTCSRDRSIQVFKIPDVTDPHNQYVTLNPCRLSLAAHRQKVRAMRFNPNSGVLGSLSTDGILHFWDPERDTPLATTRCPEVDDLVCLEVDTTTNIFACGGREYICVVDPRVADTVLR
jgi:DDB1- and CUL4-associated factor 12